MNITATEIRPEGTPAAGATAVRAFDFARDRFAFANELLWEYQFDEATGKTATINRQPKPDYALRCFVMTRAAKQFFLHAHFDATRAVADEETYRDGIRQIISRSPRHACVPAERVVFPGFDCLHAFSLVHERLLKAESGGAWRSYVLRSHWRMVLPILSGHQVRTAARLVERLRAGGLPILHLVTFPQLTMNHGVLLYEAHSDSAGWKFIAYDPNDPAKPMTITYDSARQIFTVPRNKYWPGGRLKVIEIYRNWFF
jgi:hypothetical protein